MIKKAEIVVEVHPAVHGDNMSFAEAFEFACKVNGIYIEQQYSKGHHEVLCFTTVRRLP